MIKKYIYLGVAIAVIGMVVGAFFYGKDYGETKVEARYETAANKAIKEAQDKHFKQIEQKNKKIKELDNELQNQRTIVREDKEECMDREVSDDIKSLLELDRMRK